MAAAAAFEVIVPAAGVPRAPVVAHVPHASVSIPAGVRAELLVSDAELRAELLRLTDWHTDVLFAGLAGAGATRFVNRLSRLVFDPERFLDEAAEPAAASGQGVVYWRTSSGGRLRQEDPEMRERRIEELYRPYHAALDGLVGKLLDAFGSCTVVDCHSFPTEPLPTEVPDDGERPDVCIGTDPVHTPEELVAGLEGALGGAGLIVRRDVPFAGTFVPSGFYGREPRVHSVMIEVRRGLYMDEASGERSASFETAAAAIVAAVESALPV